MQYNNGPMSVCLSIHAAAGPSIHPTIYILARGPFALCQAILIPIYHPFLCRFFFSISLFFLGASFFFKPFDSNWFLSRPLIRMPLSSFLYSSSPSSSSLSASVCCFFSFLLSFIPSYADTQMRICSPVLFRSVQRIFFISGYLREGNLWKKDARRCPKRELPKHRLDQTFARFVAHEKRMFAIRQRGKSIVRIAYYCDSLILHNYTLNMHEGTIYIPSN